ncbi:MAG: glycosyltransferase [Chloroflexi bacterium]|nr:glycosyltransferase [Chloroflexota bacterium]
MQQLNVTVVIPTFNRKLGLLRNLAKIPKDVEVIVVDDGSQDGTEQAVAQVRRDSLGSYQAGQ